MGYLIGMVHDGVLVAGTGDTSAQALGELIDEVGEHVQVCYAEALTALREEHAHPRASAPDNPTYGVPRGEDRRQTGPADTHGSGSERNRSEDETDGPHPATVETDEQARCAICGAEVTSDRAEVALDDYGEVRCKECSG